MKKILYIFCIILFMSGCKSEKTSGLPTELEEALVDYLNYQAWCNPNDWAQEETVYSYQVYRQDQEKLLFPETFLEIMKDEQSMWYRCTYTRQQEYCIEPLLEEPEGLEKINSGELQLPEISKPTFTDSFWKDYALKRIQKSISAFCGKAFEEAYDGGECIEVYLADFCMEKGLVPTMYLVCGDRVCELSSILRHQVDWMMADMSVDLWAYENEDRSFVSLDKADIDTEKFERICEIAILHAEYQKEEGLKEVFDVDAAQ